jgi:hypothetical protein
MRRILMSVVWVALVQLVSPSNALAWWEDIEALSGPGWFHGPSIDARIFCIVDSNGNRVVRVPSGLGVITTSCPVKSGEKRRAAVDLGGRFLSTKRGDNRFANGEPIRLTTFEPSVSFRVIPNDKWDFVDYSFGAGVYWFASTEFPAFNGTFLDPVRVEFHATSELRQRKIAMFIPRVRVGMLVFPRGFETAAFAAAPGVPTRISRDKVWNLGFFFDLEPLLGRHE